ncbi:glucans biosynthesis glucosyltransferase MdoH [Thiothrix winogradskyi]|uniref:Glucans biosynthesis glucosyltransferase H n=1 Tax=Thiothrix winogradskyi TaxID=96472 RepID=A0ABY3SZ40_9GAMM|nr:glucans biosynthesis glucosyltransferase MdoH [Thiothrix winogradskyi]UJS24393.1 glucans biosynthesis glucosyltransferase MdoH [Thiothrix winogradskyi]
MSQAHDEQIPWQATARRRRVVFFATIAFLTGLATFWLGANLPAELPIVWQALVLIPFAVLFLWLALGFMTAVVGLWVLNFGGQNRVASAPTSPLPQLQTRDTTAILLPIYNEDIAYVYAGLQSIYQSLEQTGQLHQFEFYILSDSDDASNWLREEAAWSALCRTVGSSERIHYRRRKHRTKKKSGNVMDFCRRWGKRHPYMVVLDADSLMTGDALIRLVDAMERNERVGLIQTPLYTIGLDTLYARGQQFVNRLYGPIFFAGLHWWWLGESQYWGHNVIIRTQAFMGHCHLPKLKEGSTLGGEILSHDFVEAALLNRAGWETWLAYDMEGSFERPPPTMTDALKRDRRWCQGNLQHWLIIWAHGIPHLHRFLLLGGIMSYVSSLIWLGWLGVLTAIAVFYPKLTLIPLTAGNSALLVLTLILLFFYKTFGLAETARKGTAHLFGGVSGLSASVATETLLSMLTAPVRMMYYSKFVVQILQGKRAVWGTQQRTGGGLTWADAWQEYGWVSQIGVAWAILLLIFNPMTFLWMSPVIAGLVLSVPLAMLTSAQTSLQTNLFRTPDEVAPDYILQAFEKNYAEMLANPCISTRDLFIRVVVDPLAFRQHMTYIPHRQHVPEGTRQQREEQVKRLLEQGPGAISNSERLIILEDDDMLTQLHTQVWQLPEARFHEHWMSKL